MRLREWYSWHFPELAKIITDNQTYAKAVILIGMRTNVKNLSIEQLQEVIPEELAEQVKEAAEISMVPKFLRTMKLTSRPLLRVLMRSLTTEPISPNILKIEWALLLLT